MQTDKPVINRMMFTLNQQELKFLDKPLNKFLRSVWTSIADPPRKRGIDITTFTNQKDLVKLTIKPFVPSSINLGYKYRCGLIASQTIQIQ
jgi:hypothetical protein